MTSFIDKKVTNAGRTVGINVGKMEVWYFDPIRTWVCLDLM